MNKRMLARATIITCSKCGVGGGTLLKIGEGKNTHYEHQNKAKCQLMKVARLKHEARAKAKAELLKEVISNG